MKEQNSGEEKRLQQRVNELQDQWNLISQKLSKLEQEKILAISPDEKFRLEHKIFEIKEDRHLIGQQLADLENELSAKKEDSLTQLRTSYLNYLHDRYYYFDMRGIPQVQSMTQHLPLQDIYIPLKAYQIYEAATIRHREQQKNQVTSETQILVEEAIRKYPAVVVLGNPGSGKSTLLKILTLNLIEQHNGILPIILPLNAYARRLQKQGRVGLFDFLGEYYITCQSKFAGIEELFKTALHDQKALILLDGLDEVQIERNFLVWLIEDFVSEYILQPQHFLSNGEYSDEQNFPSGNRIVVTSRFVGYNEAPLTPRKWRTYLLTEFDRTDIEHFTRKWTSAFSLSIKGNTDVAKEEAETEYVELLKTIESRESVENLAANPLMLTLLALIKYYGAALPNERVKLYDLYLETLIESRNRSRSLDLQAVDTKITYSKARQTLAPLAFWLREKNPAANLISRDELENWLTQHFGEGWGFSSIRDARLQGEEFLKEIQQASSILVEWGERQYGFLHPTLEEMLAANEIVYVFDSDFSHGLEVFQKYLLDSNWHEILLLTIGIIGVIRANNIQAGDIIQRILELEFPSESVNRQIVFAGEALLDMGEDKVRPPIVQKVKDALLKVMLSAESLPYTRYKAGELLGKMGDPREGVTTLPPSLTSLIDKEHLSLKAGIYPITNAQFAEFIDANGYKNQKCWSEDGWWWRQEQSRKQPDYWEDKNFNTPNHPVVGVTWYEAEAFCCWLSTKYEGKYRLPTEREWKILAGGKEGYEYPWGNEWQENFANTEESGIGQTSAVGVFSEGISLTGAYDCAGNVWEWCDDWFDEQQNRKVLRGGAWNYSQEDARCRSRSGDLPHGSLNNVGFRVIFEIENDTGGELRNENSHNS